MQSLKKLDTLKSVELADGVEIRLRIAGPMLRAVAYAIDFAIRLGILLLLGIVVAIAGLAMGEQVAQGMLLLGWFLLDWIYPIFFESGRRGATPGKRLMGLRVVQSTGSPITFGQAVVRNFLRFVDGMPFFTYGFGLASCVASQRFQRLGDLAAGTVVVYQREAPTPVAVLPPPISPLPLPVGLSADEMRALTHFRERAGLWSQARQVEIANQAAALSGGHGIHGVSRLLAMAHWVQEKRNESSP